MLKRAVACLFLSSTLSGCMIYVQPTPFKLRSVKALSNHQFEAVAYKIPKGVFRGVLWPDPETKIFYYSSAKKISVFCF